MIKFFRNTRIRLLTHDTSDEGRRDLLIEGNTTKYLKYAIGEIVLVVIGILIALSINNWNEKRKENKNFLIFMGLWLKTSKTILMRSPVF
jgi:hypothetical protein